MQTRKGGVYAKPSRTRPRAPRTYRRVPRGQVGTRNRYAIEASLHPTLRKGLELWRHPSKRERELDQMRERAQKERNQKREREEAMEKAIKQQARKQAVEEQEQERRSIAAEKHLKSVQQSLNREMRVAKRDASRRVMMNRIQEEFDKKRGSLAMVGMANALNEAVKAHEYDQVLSMLTGMSIVAPH